MVLVILFGLVVTGIGGYLVYRKRRIAHVGQRVPGTVVDVREYTAAATQGTEYRHWNPVLSFKTLDGQDIRTEVSDSGYGAGQVQVGAQVRVIYDPENPRSAEIDTPAGRSTASGFVVVIVGLLIIVLGTGIVH